MSAYRTGLDECLLRMTIRMMLRRCMLRPWQIVIGYILLGCSGAGPEPLPPPECGDAACPEPNVCCAGVCELQEKCS